MAADAAEEGGSRDGSDLAEARIVVHGQVRRCAAVARLVSSRSMTTFQPGCCLRWALVQPRIQLCVIPGQVGCASSVGPSSTLSVGAISRAW